jgi:hypothetical protein
MTNPRTNKNGLDSPFHYDENSVIRITETLNSVQLINGKIKLCYSLGYAEIISY